MIACRDNGLSEPDAKDAALTCVRSYREHMAEFGEMNVLDLWYFTLEAEMLISTIKDPGIRRRVIKRLAKARESSTSEGVFPKLVDDSRGSPLFKDQLPAIYHVKDYPAGDVHPDICKAVAMYRETLSPAHRTLFDRYEIKDAAIKVVGVGSVGTSCWVLLLMARGGEPLILQVKEARASVLEAYAGKSVYQNHGQRVVNGHRLMQSASDIFLGWTKGARGRHFYIRQLRDVKIKPAVETFGTAEMTPLCPVVRLDARALPCALRGTRGDQRVSGQERRVRQGNRHFLCSLRRSERTGPCRNPTCDPGRQDRGGRRRAEVNRSRMRETSEDNVYPN